MTLTGLITGYVLIEIKISPDSRWCDGFWQEGVVQFILNPVNTAALWACRSSPAIVIFGSVRDDLFHLRGGGPLGSFQVTSERNQNETKHFISRWLPLNAMIAVRALTHPSGLLFTVSVMVTVVLLERKKESLFFYYWLIINLSNFAGSMSKITSLWARNHPW